MKDRAFYAALVLIGSALTFGAARLMMMGPKAAAEEKDTAPMRYYPGFDHTGEEAKDPTINWTEEQNWGSVVRAMEKNGTQWIPYLLTKHDGAWIFAPAMIDDLVPPECREGKLTAVCEDMSEPASVCRLRCEP